MPEDRLARVAGAIADGTPVDWMLEEGAATPQDKPLLQQLRVVAEIASAAQGWELGDTWGSLRLVSRLGSGMFGDVFRAHDEHLQRDVALKLVREPGLASASVAEGRLLAQVRHRSVVDVYGADSIHGCAGIWMELIEGRTLEDLLRERGAWDASAAALAGAELCSALAAVHTTGLVHRDVKAQNVMRESGGRIVLMDFGVGHAQGPAGRPPAGTPLYMAPETLAGESATRRSDLYSVGVLLYHLVTGAYPVKGTTLEELRRAHAARERVFLRDARPDLPDAFVSAVERALQAEPERRYATAGEMEQALLETLRAKEPSARRAGSGRRLQAGLGVAALGALLAVVFLSRPEDTRLGLDAVVESPSPAPLPTASPSVMRSVGRPAGDPFVAPLGAGSSVDASAPASDAPYTIDARFDGRHLRIRSSAPLNLYVFAVDPADQPFLVFPVAGRASENPLVPGQETRVPVAAPFPGSRLVAVATPTRLGSFESEMARQRVPSGTQAVPLSMTTLERFAGALGFEPQAAGRFLAAEPLLRGHVEVLRGVWIRRLER